MFPGLPASASSAESCSAPGPSRGARQVARAAPPRPAPHSRPAGPGRGAAVRAAGAMSPRGAACLLLQLLLQLWPGRGAQPGPQGKRRAAGGRSAPSIASERCLPRLHSLSGAAPLRPGSDGALPASRPSPVGWREDRR